MRLSKDCEFLWKNSRVQESAAECGMRLASSHAAISLKFSLAVGLCYSHEKRTVLLRPPEIHSLSSTAFDKENQAQPVPVRRLQVQGLQSGQISAVVHHSADQRNRGLALARSILARPPAVGWLYPLTRVPNRRLPS
jgi:hypothetical protein